MKKALTIICSLLICTSLGAETFAEWFKKHKKELIKTAIITGAIGGGAALAGGTYYALYPFRSGMCFKIKDDSPKYNEYKGTIRTVKDSYYLDKQLYITDTDHRTFLASELEKIPCEE
jgi:hypothetical protein